MAKPKKKRKRAGSKTVQSARALLVGETPEGEPETYALFQVLDLSPQGAFFAGPLLLELGEEFQVRLEVPGYEPLVSEACVVQVREQPPGVLVSFPRSDAKQRAALEDRQRALRS